MITPVLENLAVSINQLRNELLIIYDESSFDSSILNLLSKIQDLVPLLTKHQLSLTIKDLKTKKIHFQQISAEIEHDKSNSITDLMNYIENQEYFQKSLEKEPAIIFIGNAMVSAFKIPKGDNIIISIKDHVDIEDLPQFRKLSYDLRKKIIDLYEK